MSKKKYLVVALIAFLLSLNLISYTNTTIGRVIRYGPGNVDHYQKFPYHRIATSSNPFKFTENNVESIVKSRFYNISYGNNQKVGDLDQFLEKTDTTSFIVIHKDRIVYEKYYNNYTQESIVTSFSVAKSFTSALVGIAIDEGYIKSVYDPITDYVPELIERDERFSNIKIIDLLHMTSGLEYKEPPDDIYTYFAPNLRKLALDNTKIKEDPNKRFLYNNYNPLLLGIILERATGRSVSKYLEEKIWIPIGMEYEGSWSIDSNDFEKMESGINCRAIDFAKFGRLFLRKGNWNGKQIISNGWSVASTAPYFPDDNDYYPPNPIFNEYQGYYSLMWWGIKRDEKNYDFYAAGNHGQYIYISPEKDLIIVRNGTSYGRGMESKNMSWWPIIFYKFTNQFTSE